MSTNLDDDEATVFYASLSRSALEMLLANAGCLVIPEHLILTVHRALFDGAGPWMMSVVSREAQRVLTNN